MKNRKKRMANDQVENDEDVFARNVVNATARAYFDRGKRRGHLSPLVVNIPKETFNTLHSACEEMSNVIPGLRKEFEAVIVAFDNTVLFQVSDDFEHVLARLTSLHEKAKSFLKAENLPHNDTSKMKKNKHSKLH